MKRDQSNFSKLAVIVIGTAMSALGFLVNIGWFVHSISMVKLSAEFAPMQFNTALCFVLCGISLVALTFDRFRIATVLGSMVFVAATLTISQYLFNLNLGIDQLLIEPFTAEQTSQIGRMSPVTAACFILSGIGLILTRRKRYINYLSVLGSLLCAGGLTMIIGFLVNLPTAFWSGQATRMSVPAAVLFVLLGIGLLIVWRRLATTSEIGWYVGAVGMASICVSMGLWQALSAQRDSGNEKTLELASINIKETLAEKFKIKVQALERMAGRWDINGGTPRSNWEADANAYIKDFKSFQEILWIDSSLQVRWKAPMLPEDKEFGQTEIESNNVLREITENVRDERIAHFSGVVTLPDGHNGTFIFIPVFRGSEFDGEIVGVINVESLVKVSLSEEINKNYLIRIYDGEKLIYKNIENYREFDAQLTKKIEIDQSDIRLPVLVSFNETSSELTENKMPEVVLLLGLLISFLLTWATYKTLLSRQQAIDGVDLNGELANLILIHQLAAEQLREVGMLNNAILDSASYSIISTDPSGLILTFNRAASEMLGYEPEEVIGKVTTAILHDIEEVVRRAQELTTELGQRIEPRFDAFVAKARLSNTADENEWTYIRKDGTRFPVHLSVTALRDDTGNITGYLGVAQDITEAKRTEAVLRENEAKFRDLFDNAPVAYHELDIQGRFTRINHTEELLLGYAEEELIGRHPSEIIVEKISREATAAKLTGKVQLHPVERTFIRKDSSLVSVLNEDRLIYDSDGNITGIRSTLQNITERKRIENALSEATKRERTIIENALDVICTLNGEGRFITINQACFNILGYQPDEIIGRHYLDFIAPDDVAKTNDAAANVTSGEELIAFENRYRHKNGTFVDLMWNVNWSESEKLMFAVAHDITQRKQIETKLKLQQIMLSESQQIAQLGSWEWDLIENTTVWSDELYRIFGFEPQEFVVTLDGFLEQIHPDDKQFVTKTLEHSLLIREFSEYDARIIQPNGNVREIHANGVMTVDVSGNPVKISGTVQDFTERKKMEMVLRNACDAAIEGTRVKTEFLANMSHEIRTPMNGIIGMTELMLDTKLGKEQERYLKNIKTCSESLLTILNDILDISKVEAGMLNFETIDFDLRYTVENVIELLTDRAEDKNLTITMKFHPDVPTQLCGDPTRLRQILTNLVSNAVKFTEKGKIVIEVSKDSDDGERAVIRFKVIDTGVGISEDTQKLLFSPFAQADSSITRLYGGTGLGLAISKSLVEMMQGNIAIESEFGHGTTVTFTLNLIKQSDQYVEVPSLSINLKDLRVLIIDDNKTNRLLLTKQMCGLGIIVEEAVDGITGIEKLKLAAAAGKPFEIVILDQVLPGISGIDIAKFIKTDTTISRTRLILMTSYARRGNRELAHKAGISAYFKKPVRRSELLDCLSAVLDEEIPDGEIESPLITKHSIGHMKAALGRHILLVEDNEVNQEVALGHLTNLGYRVDVASNGEEAVRAVTAKTYDAVLMDCQMPLMDGFEATAEIRKYEGKTKHTPIIAMTAYAMPSDRTKCMASGMDHYIAKPIKKADLKEILHDLFEAGIAAISHTGDEFQDLLTNGSAPVDLVFLMDAASNNSEKMGQYADLYVRHTTARLQELDDAIKSRSAKDVFAIAHKCVGSSSTLGMTAIVPALRALERMGKTGELKGAEEQFEIAKSGFVAITLFLEENALQGVS